MVGGESGIQHNLMYHILRVGETDMQIMSGSLREENTKIKLKTILMELVDKSIP